LQAHSTSTNRLNEHYAAGFRERQDLASPFCWRKQSDGICSRAAGAIDQDSDNFDNFDNALPANMEPAVKSLNGSNNSSNSADQASDDDFIIRLQSLPLELFLIIYEYTFLAHPATVDIDIDYVGNARSM
jgi:hypothetical protein